MLRTVSIGCQDINYMLIYKDVKNINLRIKSDGSISVSAPVNANPDVIDDFIVSKGKYILTCIKKFREQKQYLPKPKKYVSGESFKILGNELRLKVVKSDKEDYIYTDGIYIFINVCNPDDFNKKQNLYHKWIKEKTLSLYKEIAEEVYLKFKKYDVKFPVIKIRKMTSRWGSCQPDKNIITMNTNLIEYPRNCIEYVMTHEFCHFIHPNHSKDFYTLLQVMMPEWRENKSILEGIIC